jgi:predicted site-specific integrase-resolvase
MNNDDASLSAEDIAPRFGVKVDTIKSWYRRGILTGVKIGPKILRFRPSDVARFIERHETKAAVAARG